MKPFHFYILGAILIIKTGAIALNSEFFIGAISRFGTAVAALLAFIGAIASFVYADVLTEESKQASQQSTQEPLAPSDFDEPEEAEVKE